MVCSQTINTFTDIHLKKFIPSADDGNQYVEDAPFQSKMENLNFELMENLKSIFQNYVAYNIMDFIKNYIPKNYKHFSTILEESTVKKYFPLFGTWEDLSIWLYLHQIIYKTDTFLKIFCYQISSRVEYSYPTKWIISKC